MSGKFMNIKRFTIPTITLAIIASQLMGCAAVSQSELLQMINNAEEIEIEIATPINQEQGTEQQLDWIQLDQLKTHPELRALMDDLFKVMETNGTKNGPMYVDLEGNQNGNNTLYNVFMNSKFRDYYNDSLIRTEISNEVLNTYVDIEFDGNDTTVPMYAALNAYFNLLADATPGYNNPNSTLTRAEAMAALFKAENPVTDSLASDQDFQAQVDSANKNENTIYASNMSEVSYLDIESKSLNNMTFNGTITRGEFIYMLVQQYFQEDYNKVDPKVASNYSDIKNGGDIATEQKFIENNTPKDYWKSYELTYALQNPDHGAPESIYKALAVAYEKDLINGNESLWDVGLTKNDFFELLTNTYQALPSITNTERGAMEELEVEAEAPIQTNEDGATVITLDPETDYIEPTETSTSSDDELMGVDEMRESNRIAYEKGMIDKEEYDFMMEQLDILEADIIASESKPSTPSTSSSGITPEVQAILDEMGATDGDPSKDYNGVKELTSNPDLAGYRTN